MNNFVKPSFKINIALSLLVTGLLWVFTLLGAWLLPLAAEIFYDNPYYVVTATLCISFAVIRLLYWD